MNSRNYVPGLSKYDYAMGGNYVQLSPIVKPNTSCTFEMMMAVRCFFWLLLIPFASIANAFQVFEENGKVGLRNEQGQVLIPAQYESLGWSNGNFSVINKVTGYRLKGLWGLIGIDNKKIIPAHFESLVPGEGSLLIAQKRPAHSLRTYTGCVHTHGKEVIPFQYDGIKLNGLRAIVFTKTGNQFKYGVIDLENKTIIPQQYKAIESIGSLRFAVRNFENRLALFSDQGKQLSSFIIDSLSAFKRNYSILYQNKKQGVINRDGEIKVEPVYRAVEITEQGAIRVRGENTWFFIDGKNKEQRKTEADDILPVQADLILLTIGGRILFTNSDLAPYTSKEFVHVNTFQRGKAIVRIDKRRGVADARGNIIIQPVYDSLMRTNVNYVAAQNQNNKPGWHLLDTLGNRLTAKAYECIMPLAEDFFPVRYRGYAGVLNLAGKEVIACTYDSILQIKDDLVAVKFRGQYGVVTLTEEWKVTPRNNKIVLLGDDRYLEITPRTKFLKSINGTIIYFTDNPLDVFDTHFIEHLPSGTRWKIDRDGRIVDRQIQPDEPLEMIGEESEGYRAIIKNGQAGFIDAQGRLRIANRYEAVRPFHEGLAPMKIRGHWGFLNKEDKIAIQPVYDEVSFFVNGFAYVQQKGLHGIIDKNGKQVLPVRYEEATILPTGNVLIKLNGLIGLADPAGNVLVQPRFHHLQDVGGGYTIVDRDGKYGVVTHQGLSTIPLIYDFIRYNPFTKNFLVLKKADWVNIVVQ